MFEFILFIFVIVFLIWISNLSSRLSILEKKFFQKNNNIPASLVATPAPFTPADFHKLDEHKKMLGDKSAETHPAIQHMPEIKDSMTSPVANTTDLSPYGWITKFGVLAIALGIVFFFKYAIDNGWVNEWMRILFGVVVGGLFLVLGELWKNKYEKYAYALSGGGILILGFTIYAAFNFYHKIPYGLALVLMVADSALAVWLSTKRKSLTLAILGIVGAYGAPLFLDNGTNQQVFLFSYLMLLSAAVMVVLFKRFWMELVTLAFVGVIVDFSIWSSNFSTVENSWTSIWFVILSIILFIFVVAIFFRSHAIRKTLAEDSEKSFGIFSVICGIFYIFAIRSLTNFSPDLRSLLPVFMLLGSVIWWIAYALVDRLNFRNLNYWMSLGGATLITLAAYWQFNGKAFALALLALAVLGVVVGSLVKRSELRTWGTIVLYISLAKAILEPYGVGDDQFIFNAKFGLMVLEIAGTVFCGWLYTKVFIEDKEKNIQDLSDVVAAILIFLALTLDIGHSFRGAAGAQSMALWWVMYPPLLAWFAFAGKKSMLKVIALILLVLGAFRVLFLPYDNSAYVFFFNAKFGLMLLQAAAFLAIAALSTNDESSEKEVGVADLLKVAASVYAWFAVSWEIVHYFSLSGSSNTRNLLLSVWWMVYGVILMIVSTVKGFSLYRKVAVLFLGLAIAKVFLYDVSALDPAFRIASFIILGVILLSVSFVYQKNKEKITQFLKGGKKD